jgi:hypothetical protein
MSALHVTLIRTPLLALAAGRGHPPPGIEMHEEDHVRADPDLGGIAPDLHPMYGGAVFVNVDDRLGASRVRGAGDRFPGRRGEQRARGRTVVAANGRDEPTGGPGRTIFSTGRTARAQPEGG